MRNTRRSTVASGFRLVLVSASMLLVGSLLVSSVRADEIETKDGTVYRGKLLKELENKVVFQANLGGVMVNMDFPFSNVKAVTVNGVRRMAKPGAKAGVKPKAVKPAAVAKNERTESQVDELIDDVGRTKPDWFDAITISPPPTLKLNWLVTRRGIQPHVNLNQYIDMIITPSPSRWKEGVKLMYHVGSVNRTSLIRLKRSQTALAKMYFNYFGDYARAAYWYRKAGGRNNLQLATCYYRLGCKPLAAKMLKAFRDDHTPDGNVIRLWAEMGETSKAVFYGEQTAQAGRPDVGYLAAGDALRRDGQFSRAQTYYQKVIDAQKGSVNIKRNTARATANLEATKLQAALRLSQIPDGTYAAQGAGYQTTGPISVSVTMAGGSLEAVRVLAMKDKRGFISKTEMPKRIIAKQVFLAPPAPDPLIKVRRKSPLVIKEEPGSVVEWLAFKDLDTVSGATHTSSGIFNAAIKALSTGQPAKKE